MRRLVPAAAAVLLATLAVSLAAPDRAWALAVRGQVVLGQERRPVAGHPVQLHVVRGDEELKGSTATTNAAGEYEFPGLKGDPGLSYYVSTEYQNAFYTEGPLPLDSKHTLRQDLVVYEVGRDISAVQVKNQHIIIERKPDGFHVTEVLIVENKGPTAYLGTGPDHAENAGIRLGLPASVDDFQQGMGGDAQTTHVRGRELSSERPIPPGVHPFSFTYRIPLSGRVDLSHRLYYPTESFVVLVDDPKLKVESKALQFEGNREQGGKQYAVYSGATLGVGQEIPIRLGGASFWSSPRVYPWIAAPFLIAGALWYASRRGKVAREAAHLAREHAAQGSPAAHAAASPPPAGAEPRGPMPPSAPSRPAGTIPMTAAKTGGSTDEDFRRAYLFLVAALDDGLERGEYTRETHGLIRQNLKRRLQALLAEEPASKAR